MKSSCLLAVPLALLAHLSAPALAQTGANEVTAGEHAKEGADARDKKDVVVAGETPSQTIEPAPKLEPPAPGKTAIPPEPAPSGSLWPRQQTVGITVMAVGGASIAAGIATGIIALVKYGDLRNRGCTESTCPASVVSSGDLASARTFANVSTGTLIGGVAAWTGGIILLATATNPLTVGARVTPVLGLDHIGVTVKF